MTYYLKEDQSKYFCSHMMNIMAEISEDKSKAMFFETQEQAQEYKTACEYDLNDFTIEKE